MNFATFGAISLVGLIKFLNTAFLIQGSLLSRLILYFVGTFALCFHSWDNVKGSEFHPPFPSYTQDKFCLVALQMVYDSFLQYNIPQGMRFDGSP